MMLRKLLYTSRNIQSSNGQLAHLNTEDVVSQEGSVTPRNTGSTSEATPFQYWAFISYSHKDEKWAKWLQRNIETYKVYKNLTRVKDGLHDLPNRLFPVFRDRDELAAAADLPEKIRWALEHSRFLVVVCSPNAAQSRWVNEEIRAFKALNQATQHWYTGWYV
jgi:hypothetical protein